MHTPHRFNKANASDFAKRPPRLGIIWLLAIIWLSVGLGHQAQAQVAEKDLIIIMDSSASISPDRFAFIKEISKRFVCGDVAPDPTVTPIGLVVMQFASDTIVEIPYTVITSVQEAADACVLIDNIIQDSGGTNPRPAFQIAHTIFQSEATSQDRQILFISDGGFSHSTQTINVARLIRQMNIPVKICAIQLGNYPIWSSFNIDMTIFANSVHSPEYDPLEPTGEYAFIHTMDIAKVVCNDCTCDEDCIGFLEFLDCNNNDKSDGCDIAAGISLDCNENLIPDVCDIADGTSPDCNENGLADDCDIDPFFYDVSDRLWIHRDLMALHTIVTPTHALGPVTLRFQGAGLLAGADHSILCLLNGAFIGNLFELNGTDCQFGTYDMEEITIDASTFNSLVGSGAAVFEFNTDDFTSRDCLFASIQVETSYDNIPANDLNQNGIPDECEIRSDLNGDLVVNVEDLLILLAAWGATTSNADLNNNGIVSVEDLIILLGDWE